MKNLKTVLAACIITLSIFTPLSTSGYPVFDSANWAQNYATWLSTVDQLYAQYDMVANAITQVQNQFKSIQQAAERAKNIDWDNIRFDGDWDIRNDIRDVNRRVNRLLTETRNITTLIDDPQIKCGDVSYSLADLCGAGDKDKDFSTAVKDYGMWSHEAWKQIADGLDEKQQKTIVSRYGISPQNYVYVQQSNSYVRDKASKVLAKVSDVAQNMEAEELSQKLANIANALEETRDSDGNTPIGSLLEGNAKLMDELITRIFKLNNSIDDMAAENAIKDIADLNAEEAKKKDAEDKRKLIEHQNSKAPLGFIK